MPTGTISTYEYGVDLVIEWKNEHFFILPEVDGLWLYSPEFSFGGEIWFLVIYPNGSSESDSSRHVDLELRKCISNRSIKQSFSLSLKTAKGEKFNEQLCTKYFGNSYSENYHELLRFISRSEITRRKSELVPDGVLMVVCTMKNTTSAESSEEQPKENSEKTCLNASTQAEQKGESCASGHSTNPHEQKVLHDFKELFLQKEDYDVVIKVKGSEFPAHRFVLKARSPVFASTFRHNMKESATGIVEIEDCDPSSFLDFLSFLYCGDIGMISRENVFSLFITADKYEVLDLKTECLDFMKKNITVDTFCETITLALQHSETELISLATDFFVKNAEEILLTVKWQTFAAENPTQSNELVIKFVRSVKH